MVEIIFENGAQLNMEASNPEENEPLEWSGPQQSIKLVTLLLSKEYDHHGHIIDPEISNWLNIYHALFSTSLKSLLKPVLIEGTSPDYRIFDREGVIT